MVSGIVRTHGNATLAGSLFTDHTNLERMRVDGGHDAPPLLAPAAERRSPFRRRPRGIVGVGERHAAPDVFRLATGARRAHRHVGRDSAGIGFRR
jgi:hypothetical protein